MRRRVAITGIGLVTPVGATTQESWDAVIKGVSGIKVLDDPMLADYYVQIAGIVTGEQEQLDQLLSLKEQHKTERFIHLAVMAAGQAIAQADIAQLSESDRLRAGVYVGVGIGGLPSIVVGADILRERGIKRISPYLLPKVISNEAASVISMQWNLQGPALSLSSACSSGADAIGQAYRAIQFGYSDVMLAGGAESVLTPMAIGGFGNMRALSSWQGEPAGASRPFDADRNGFVIAEGAGMLVLEALDAAEKRGASIIAEVVGYGASCDAYHMTALHPEGRGAQHALRFALQDAGIVPEQVAYINAHGTGTPMNDAIETLAIKKVFGPYAKDGLCVSSTKSMTGHMLGAAGGVEAGFTALALQHQLVPPTINIVTPDPRCDLDYVPDVARSITGDYALTNSFGFGGSNAVLALRRT